MLKRTIQCNLNKATNFKKSKLNDFFEEYTRVVNCFIEIYWNGRKLPIKANAIEYKLVTSWLLGKAMKCAVNQSIKKSNQLKEKMHKKHINNTKEYLQNAKN